MADLREQLAAIEHERWARWQEYMHSRGYKNHVGDLVIPAELVERWERQIVTPYEELSETEKHSDREQVDRYWHLIDPDLRDPDRHDGHKVFSSHHGEGVFLEMVTDEVPPVRVAMILSPRLAREIAVRLIEDAERADG